MLPGSRTVRYIYDTAGRLAGFTDWQQRTTSFTYDADSRRTSITRPGNVVTTNTYDAAGRLTDITHTRAGTTLQNVSYMYAAADPAVARHATGARPMCATLVRSRLVPSLHARRRRDPGACPSW